VTNPSKEHLMTWLTFLGIRGRLHCTVQVPGMSVIPTSPSAATKSSDGCQLTHTPCMAMCTCVRSGAHCDALIFQFLSVASLLSVT
jgi:hypothetical protein